MKNSKNSTYQTTNLFLCFSQEKKYENKSYDDSVKLLRTEIDPFRLG